MEKPPAPLYLPTAVETRQESGADTSAVEHEAVFRAAPDGFFVVDAEGAIRDLNPAAERMFGYDRAELLGLPIETLVPDRSRGIHRAEREAYARDPHARPMGIGLELAGRRKDGSEFPVEISLSPMAAGAAQHVVAAVRDVTERQRLRAFGVGALRAAEEERQRIARELHDDTAQRLATLLVRLQLAMRVGRPADRDAMLGDIRAGIEDAADSVRRIARNLRPPALDEVGVVGAIRMHARSLRESYGLAVEVEAQGEEPHLVPDIQLAMYRIVQEALSNVVRHSGAQAARAAFAITDHVMQVTVEDQGRGFDPRAIEREGRGLGLLGMRERARFAGAKLTIDSTPGGGTRVVLRLPVEERHG